MERIQENLVVVTSQCDGALQLTALNSGFDAITLRADLSSSSNVNLRVVEASFVTDDVNSALQFECQVHSFERKVLAHILNVPGERAFVRVHYDVKDVHEPAVDEIQQAQQDREHAILEATRRAQEMYNANSSGVLLRAGSAPRPIAQRCCADVNRFFTKHNDSGVRFVDISFPPTLASLIGRVDSGGTDVLTSADSERGKGGEGVASAALYSLASWMHLHDAMNVSWMFATAEKTSHQRSSHRNKAASPSAPLQPPRLTQFRSVLPDQDSLIAALSYLALNKHTWLKRLVTTTELLEPHNGDDAVNAVQELTMISVQLCEHGMQWRQIIVDLFVPVFPIGCGMIAVCAPFSGEVYPTILQKALAKLKGSYKAIERMSTVAILRELTGVPWVNIYRANEKQTRQAHYATVTTQEALQRLISRRHGHRHHNSKKKEREGVRQVFVVSFAAIRGHRIAFPVLAGGDEDQGIVLQDMNGAIAKALGRSANPNARSTNLTTSDDDEDLVARCSWEELFQLEPHVWMGLVNHRESTRKRVKFMTRSTISDPPRSLSTQLQFAFSLMEMTSVVFVTQLEGMQSSDFQRCSLTLDAVGSDFSLTRIASETARECSDSTYSEIQLVMALGAGEFVLSVEIESKSELRLEKLTKPKGAARNSTGVFTHRDPERNLQLLFDCIDQDMDGVVSISELQIFLEKHEPPDVFQFATDPRALSTFMQRFGTPICISESYGSTLRSDSLESLMSSSRDQLLVGDLSEVYRFLASASAETLPASNTQETALEIEQRRYEELIWDDLTALLLPHDNQRTISSFTEDEIAELRCCVHADAPLVSLVQLPADPVVQ